MPGPFDVDPTSVERLGAAFALFVNDLLAAEVGRAGLLGFQLDINSQTNTADGGVDAALWSSNATDWLPDGDSAWQFKSSDLEPAECKEELKGAAFARDLMSKGATYVLVLGRPLVRAKKESRLDALREQAEALGLDGSAIRLYEGNQLARWVSTLPALALDRRLGGPGPAVLDFERWSGSAEHRERWVACPSRGEMETAVMSVSTGHLRTYRLEGGSGLGKTRLAMEVLRSADTKPLVVYAPRAEQLQPETVSYLCDGERTSILVVDNCSRAYHQSIVEQIDGRKVRLLTIGIDAEERLVRTPLHQLPPAENGEIDAILQENVPGLWPEAGRVVHENCFGNIRTALLLAARLVESGEQNVTALLQENDFRHLIATLLPEHADFFPCAVLALLERVGWDRDRRHQLELLCEFAGIDIDLAQTAARHLETAGLFTRQGRYRSLVPQPVAVFLAASAWEHFGDRILDELAPMCDAEMLTGLFHRAAELGRFPPVREVLRRLLSKDGPYGSLERIEASNAELLVQLAIVLPDETTMHLSELIESEALDSIRSQRESRRALVRALEKLVWHSTLFSRAADCLLRLALAENETWANNATGLWSGLFAARLPTTAASPSQRIEYLNGRASSTSSEVRLLVAKAITAALHPYESAMVSGELQEGTIVEPRGSVRSLEEALDYWISLLNVLDGLRGDEDPDVADAAVEGLIGALHPFVDVPRVGARLGDIVASFSGEGILEMRTDENDPVARAVQDLLSRLPALEPLERLHDLVRSNPWDWRDETRVHELATLIDDAVRDGSIATVGEWLRDEELPSAWRLGNAMGARSDRASLRALVVMAADANAPALAGYLAAVEEQEPGAFDRFIDVEEGRSMPESNRLFLSTAGPRSEAATSRVLDLSRAVSVTEAAGRTIYWQEDLATEVAAGLLQDWMSRIDSDRDYAAVIDWLQMLAHRRGGLPPELNSLTLELLHQRLDYPNIGHQRYDWCQLAAGLARGFPDELARDVLDLVSRGGLTLLDSDHEAAVLRAAAAVSPKGTWDLVAGRIEQGDWRTAMTLRGWFAEAIPAETILDWVGDSKKRAELVASIAPAGGDRPSELAILLLDRYPDNEEIAGSLAGEFQSGGWVGPWSDRLETQITQLQGWRQDGTLPVGVRNWAARMIEGLQRQRQEALEREVERGY
jgi:hypothetical protein